MVPESVRLKLALRLPAPVVKSKTDRWAPFTMMAALVGWTVYGESIDVFFDIGKAVQEFKNTPVISGDYKLPKKKPG